jgi:hypothetical protein
MSVTSGRSAYLSKKLADLAASQAAFTPAATLYLALFTVSIINGDATTGTEATGTGYARLAITNNATNFPAGSGTTTPITKSLHTAQTMATAGGSWSSGSAMIGFGLFDASTTGNLYYYGTLSTSLAVASGYAPTFAADAINWTEQ